MILYIGNNLSIHGNTPTSIETLGTLLKNDFNLIKKSDKKNKILRLLDMLSSIIKYRKKIDYLLIDTYSTSNFYFALISSFFANILNIKYIPMLRGGNLPDRLKNNPLISRLMFSKAYVNVAPSNYLYINFKQEGYNVVFIPNNIVINNYPFLERKNIKPKLLFVRAFSKVYNPKMALYVLKKLIIKYPNAELCMIGPDRDGSFEEVKALSYTLGLEDNIILKGKMKKEDWWNLSKDYDIFINTTNFDNTPVSVMEAMALGLPVVSTNVGGIPYLLNDGKDALLVDKNDIDGMYEKICELLNNNEKSLSITQNARKKVESFDWSIIKKQWIDLLERKS